MDSGQMRAIALSRGLDGRQECFSNDFKSLIYNNTDAPDEPVVPRVKTFSAYAVGSNSAYGWSELKTSRQSAEEDAVMRCYGYGGSSCKPVLWMSGKKCMALTTAPHGGYGAAWAYSKIEAIRKSESLCNSKNFYSCKLRHYHCNR